VYLPGDENYSRLGLADGMCLGGGAGGDYFAVGNPKAFYLRADGDVTVKWLSKFPPRPEETPKAEDNPLGPARLRGGPSGVSVSSATDLVARRCERSGWPFC
jgi:hypothetical protein